MKPGTKNSGAVAVESRNLQLVHDLLWRQIFGVRRYSMRNWLHPHMRPANARRVARLVEITEMK